MAEIISKKRKQQQNEKVRVPGIKLCLYCHKKLSLIFFSTATANTMLSFLELRQLTVDRLKL